MLSRKLLLIAALFALAGHSPLKPGDPFPELGQFKLEGPLPADLAGKVVLVDFWASWCNPCKASFPAMEQLLERHGKDGLVIVAVNLDDKRADMEAFSKRTRSALSWCATPRKNWCRRSTSARCPRHFCSTAPARSAPSTTVFTARKR